MGQIALRLDIAGRTSGSARVGADLRGLSKRELPSCCDLEVVDAPTALHMAASRQLLSNPTRVTELAFDQAGDAGLPSSNPTRVTELAFDQAGDAGLPSSSPTRVTELAPRTRRVIPSRVPKQMAGGEQLPSRCLFRLE